MMPSAKTVARPKLPPANRSYKLKRVPWPWLRRKSARDWTFTPGVAMWAPMRYTTRHKSGRRIFSFSSGTLNRLGGRGAVIDSARDRAAGLLDLRARRRGNRHALHAELARHVAHAQQLNRAVRPAHQSGAEQGFRRHLHALGEAAEVAYVHHLCRLFEGVREASLGDAADERHLPALEPRARLPAGACGLTLAAPAGRLPDPPPGPASLAHPGAVRPTGRLQCGARQLHDRAHRHLRPRRRPC